MYHFPVIETRSIKLRCPERLIPTGSFCRGILLCLFLASWELWYPLHVAVSLQSAFVITWHSPCVSVSSHDHFHPSYIGLERFSAVLAPQPN